MSSTVLVCDDDPVQRRLLEGMIRKFGYDVIVVDGGEAAIRTLSSPQGEAVAVVVLDLVMPDLDGMGVLARMREAGLVKPVIVQTSHGGIDVVVSAMRAGAVDFVVKPVGAERLQVSLRNALKTHALENEIQRIKRKTEGTLTFKDIITRSPRMNPVIRMAEKGASSTIPVLIEGESGVGKELMARAIAGSSERAGKPFVAVNCGAIPGNLVESILFGHEKGAFTGATEKHSGKFVEASGGTLFLDEVGELPLDTQVKLLRALQEGEVDPVGAKRPVKVDIRIVSATNRDLIQAVKNGTFREDLYYRLCVFPITLPPLRERKEDIAELSRHFVARFAAEEGKTITGISAEAMTLMNAYDWPGNVRQLENTLFRAVVLCEAGEIGVADIPQVAVQVDGARLELPGLGTAHVHVQPVAEPVRLQVPAMIETPLSQLSAPPLAPAAAQPAMIMPKGPMLALTDESGHMRTMEAVEQEVIRFALDHYKGQMSQIARRLGIGRSTLYRKLKEMGIDMAEEAG